MAHAIIFYDTVIRTGTRPAGAYAVASVLRRQGLEVLVVPFCAGLSFNGVKQIIENNSANLLWVGISTTFFKTLQYNKETLENYRNQWRTTQELTLSRDDFQKHPNARMNEETLIWDRQELNLLAQWLDEKFQRPLLLGGPNVISKNKLMLHPNVHCVTGYAESYVAEITNNLLQKTQDPIPVLHNNSHYDDIEFKTNSLKWAAHDFIKPNEWLPLEVSRGCSFNCAYCTYERKSTFDSFKNPESLRQEIIENYERWGVTKYILVDDLYNDSKEKVRVLYDKVWSKLPFQIEWASYMRLDMFWNDPESIDIVKASGARAGGFGIETLHTTAGRKVGKGLGKTRILETLQALKEKWRDEIMISAFMIAGLPYEPWDSILESWKWSRTTDLLHGSIWQVLYVRPPFSDFRIVPGTQSTMDKDPYSFDMSWPDNNSNWINSEGVTRNQCLELLSQAWDPFDTSFGFHKYAQLRQEGIDHHTLINAKNGSISLEALGKINQKKHAAELLYLNKVLKYKS